jgi:hypothetical protein
MQIDLCSLYDIQPEVIAGYSLRLSWVERYNLTLFLDNGCLKYITLYKYELSSLLHLQGRNITMHPVWLTL